MAFESACTHEGVTCYYDSGQQKIVCPRHNALFDPANNASVLQGPPNRPRQPFRSGLMEMEPLRPANVP
ncbi:Rieske 2Fe-2S domain-containing protein [Reticulibacter mediterranei]|uniref:Rieske 2Fe-2S domain-containing protein n=1 Tax=Reticulibacter mediterranei TaxID=2778369 RepID=UPI001C6898C5